MVLLYRNNSSQEVTSFHSKPICSYFYSLIWCVLSCESVNTNLIVFGLPPLSEIMVGCKCVSGVWTVLHSLLVKYNMQQLSIINSVLGLDVDGTLQWYIHHLPLYLCQTGHPIHRYPLLTTWFIVYKQDIPPITTLF